MTIAKRARISRARATRFDDRAVASLVLGTTGLFFFNILFGPLAIALGVLAARRHRTGGRDHTAALVGVALGVADLLVLAVLIVGQLRHGDLQWRT